MIKYGHCFTETILGKSHKSASAIILTRADYFYNKKDQLSEAFNNTSPGHVNITDKVVRLILYYKLPKHARNEKILPFCI